MPVKYKFKSATEYEVHTFDGLHISQSDLKEVIMKQKGLNSTTDLQITKEDTGHVYGKSDLIEKNTCLIIIRLPGPGSVNDNKRIAKTRPDPSLTAATAGPSTYLPARYSRPSAPSGATTSVENLAQVVDLSQVEAPEGDKIKAMIIQSRRNYETSTLSKPRGKGVRADGIVAPNYSCHNCLQVGDHLRKNCPSKHSVKKSSGIPNSFMRSVDGPAVPGAMITPSGHYAVSIIDHKAHLEETNKGGAQQEPPPKDLICCLCRGLLEDAVLIPCCGKAFCDECIRSHLLASDDHECPECMKKYVSPDSLIPNRSLRTSVTNFNNGLPTATLPEWHDCLSDAYDAQEDYDDAPVGVQQVAEEIGIPATPGTAATQLPNSTIPELEQQPVSISELEQQQVSIPELDHQQVSIPELEHKQVSIPELELQQVSIPELELQQLSIPEQVAAPLPSAQGTTMPAVYNKNIPPPGFDGMGPPFGFLMMPPPTQGPPPTQWQGPAPNRFQGTAYGPWAGPASMNVAKDLARHPIMRQEVIEDPLAAFEELQREKRDRERRMRPQRSHVGESRGRRTHGSTRYQERHRDDRFGRYRPQERPESRTRYQDQEPADGCYGRNRGQERPENRSRNQGQEPNDGLHRNRGQERPENRTRYQDREPADDRYGRNRGQERPENRTRYQDQDPVDGRHGRNQVRLQNRSRSRSRRFRSRSLSPKSRRAQSSFSISPSNHSQNQPPVRDRLGLPALKLVQNDHLVQNQARPESRSTGVSPKLRCASPCSIPPGHHSQNQVPTVRDRLGGPAPKLVQADHLAQNQARPESRSRSRSRRSRSRSVSPIPPNHQSQNRPPVRDRLGLPASKADLGRNQVSEQPKKSVRDRLGPPPLKSPSVGPANWPSKPRGPRGPRIWR